MPAGATTRDPAAAVALRPLGGEGFGYKGAGLAGMVDILCSAFTGMGHGATFPSDGRAGFRGADSAGPFLPDLNPATFQALAAFDARVGAFLADLRGQPALPGETVMAPGDIEKAEAERRARAGIPVDRTTWAALAAAARPLWRRGAAGVGHARWVSHWNTTTCWPTWSASRARRGR